MSTRCQIGIYKDKDTPLKEWKVLLYRHCDGYPGKEDGTEYGVLPDIIPFLRRFGNTRGIADYEYCGAWLIHHLIEKRVKSAKEIAKKYKHSPKDGRTFCGYGICKEFHGDIDFFYKVYPEGVDVYEVGFDATSISDWKRIKTIPLYEEKIKKDLGLE